MKVLKKVCLILLFGIFIVLFNNNNSYSVSTSDLFSNFNCTTAQALIGTWIDQTISEDNNSPNYNESWRKHWACIEIDKTGSPGKSGMEVLNVIDVYTNGTVEVTGPSSFYSSQSYLEDLINYDPNSIASEDDDRFVFST